jgi:hypothetical protein
MRLLTFQRSSNWVPTVFQRGVPTLPPYPPRPLEGGRALEAPPPSLGRNLSRDLLVVDMPSTPEANGRSTTNAPLLPGPLGAALALVDGRAP